MQPFDTRDEALRALGARRYSPRQGAPRARGSAGGALGEGARRCGSGRTRRRRVGSARRQGPGCGRGTRDAANRETVRRSRSCPARALPCGSSGCRWRGRAHRRRSRTCRRDRGPWRRTEWGRVAKLLRHPRLRREARRGGEHEFAGGKLDEHERDYRVEEHVVVLQEVAHPGLTAVVLEESRPPLSSRRGLAHDAHVLLDRTLADADAELEQFSTDPLGAPESVRRGHGPDQRGRLRSEARRGAYSAPPPPESLEAGAVPAKKRLGLDDAQYVPPGRRDGSERDQGDPVKPSHARPANRALQHGELMSEQGDLGEQRPARAKDIRHGDGDHEHGFEHGRTKVAPRSLDFSLIREVAMTGGGHLQRDVGDHGRRGAHRGTVRVRSRAADRGRRGSWRYAMIPPGVEIFVGVEPIDLRWGFDRLSGIVSERIARPPRSGALYVFFGKRRDAIKILFADASGICVFYKRLDRGEAMSQGSAGGGTEQGRTKHVWRKSCHFNDVASANAKLQDVLVLSTAGISGPNESFVRR